MVRKIYQKRKNPGQLIENLLPVLKPDFGIIQRVSRGLYFYDEPKSYKFNAFLKNTGETSDGKVFRSGSSGFSFSDESEALLKCIGEAIERFSIKVYREEDLLWGPYKNYKSVAVAPQTIVSFSEKQKTQKELKDCVFDDSSPFSWVKGYSLTDNREILIPTQLVYLSYVPKKEEKVIRLPISTGAAGGISLNETVYRGACEIIERDSFMIFWLNKLSPPKVNLHSLGNKMVERILKLAQRYRLLVYTFDLTTDLSIPSFLTLVIDKTGIGAAVSTGLKARLDPVDAILGSIEESMNARAWIRHIIEDEKPKIRRKWKQLPITTLKERGIFWYPKERIKLLNFLLKSNRKSSKEYYPAKQKAADDKLETLVTILKKKGCEVLYKDVGLDKVKNLGYETIVVVIPELQPLYLDERYPYFGGKRLYRVPQDLGYTKKETTEDNLFKVPHPFL